MDQGLANDNYFSLGEMMVEQEPAGNFKDWVGMDGAIAWHIIDRHAEDWSQVGQLMNAWLRANIEAEREACAKVCEEAGAAMAWSAAADIRNRSK